MDLRKLADPFPIEDVKWRVLKADIDRGGTAYCIVFPYIKKRAIQQRLDDICGPANWCNTPLAVLPIEPKLVAMQVGISICIDGKWVTKYDVAECTDIEPVKGGFSGASKRAGSQWGIGRYLEHIAQERIILARDKKDKASNYLWMKANNTEYYWNTPKLPNWAVPRINTGQDDEKPVSEKDRTDLYFAWRKKFAPNEKDKGVLRLAFDSWVFSVVKEFPIGDLSCWTQNIVTLCSNQLLRSTHTEGPTGDVDFDT